MLSVTDVKTNLHINEMLQDMLAHIKVSKIRKKHTNVHNVASSSHTLVY